MYLYYTAYVHLACSYTLFTKCKQDYINPEKEELFMHAVCIGGGRQLVVGGTLDVQQAFVHLRLYQLPH